LPELRLEYLAPSSLKPNTRNARLHSKKQIGQVADSIRKFGFTNPLLIDEHRTILAGHGRFEAAKLLNLERLPCVRLDHMTAEQKRVYALADNKLALNAGWDEEILAQELQALLEIDLDFDIGLTGFSIAEIDSFIEGLKPEEPGDPEDDRLPALDKSEVISRPGDLWSLGRHRVLCGDALDRASYDRLLGGERAQMVFTDPPYNVPIAGHVGGLGRIKHREFAMASGEMTRSEFTGFLRTAFEHLASYSVDGSIHFICMDWRHMAEVHSAAEPVYSELKNLCVWVKDNGGMGTFYRSRHELVFAFKKGEAPFEQLRAGPAWAVSHQCLAVQRSEYPQGRS